LPGHRYRVIRKLGSGSMGEVHLAEDTRLHRRVAIKSIRADRTAAGQILRRIRRECLLHARIGAHPHIVTLFDLHEEGDQLNLVMEYVEGDTLDHIFGAYRKEGRSFPVASSVDIAIQCLRGLAHVHARGIIHRDMKPANIMLTRDSAGGYIAKIMDFGVARQEEQDPEITTLTHPGGRSPGTPLYMAPEQIDSVTYGPVVPASDLYAVGVMLYQLISGQPPFTGSLTDVFNGHLNLDPRPIRRPSGAGIHPMLEAAIDRALEKHAHLRFASAAEFAEELESIRALVTSGQATDESDDESMLVHAWHGSLTRWAIAGLAGLAIAAVAFVGLRDEPIQMARDIFDRIVSAPAQAGIPSEPLGQLPETTVGEITETTGENSTKPAQPGASSTKPAPPRSVAAKPAPLPAPKVVPAVVQAATPAPQAAADSPPPAPAPDTAVKSPTPAPESTITSPAPAPVTEITPPTPAPDAVVTPPTSAPDNMITPPITPPDTVNTPSAPEPVLDDGVVMDEPVGHVPGLESIEVPAGGVSATSPAPAQAPGGAPVLEVAEVPITVEASEVLSLNETESHPIDEEVGLEPVTVTKPVTPEPVPVQKPDGAGQTYTVSPGDTLDIIARRFSLSREQLTRWNTIPNPDSLQAGQVLYLYERPGLAPVVENSNALDMGKRESKSKEILRKTKERLKELID
jgi:serine/threonine-protein kinase